MTITRVFPDADALGFALAAEIADGIEAAAATGHRYVLGCPGGRSPRPVYRALTAEVGRRQLDIAHVVIAMMDEYVSVEGGSPRNVDPAVPHSCARFAREVIAEPMTKAGSGSPGIWVPEAADPDDYDRRVTAAGVDLFILASGSGDGHVAFNSPGTPVTARSRVVELPDSTRRDNIRTHPEFGTIDNAPHAGVTIGTATLIDCARRVVMIAHGVEKRTAARHLTSATAYDPSWPATIVHACRHAEIYLDAAAVS